MFVDTQYSDVKRFHAADLEFIPEASDAIHSLVALVEKELDDIDDQVLKAFLQVLWEVINIIIICVSNL